MVRVRGSGVDIVSRMLGVYNGCAIAAIACKIRGADHTEDAACALPALAEPLTRKEIRILELLAEGYSNAAMAEKLFVSDSTVRTHLRNINTKLGARSRTQAVALGRRLGLIR